MHALEMIIIITGTIMALVAVAGIAWLVRLARSDRQAPPIAVPSNYQLAPPDQRPELKGSSKQVLRPGREIHLHLNVTSDQLAAIMRYYAGEE